MAAKVVSDAEIREWAVKQGIDVNERGRIPGHIKEQYATAKKKTPRQVAKAARRPRPVAVVHPVAHPVAVGPENAMPTVLVVRRNGDTRFITEDGAKIQEIDLDTATEASVLEQISTIGAMPVSTVRTALLAELGGKLSDLALV